MQGQEISGQYTIRIPFCSVKDTQDKKARRKKEVEEDHKKGRIYGDKFGYSKERERSLDIET